MAGATIWPSGAALPANLAEQHDDHGTEVDGAPLPNGHRRDAILPPEFRDGPARTVINGALFC